MKQLAYILIFLCSIEILVSQNNPTKIEMVPSNWNIPNDAMFEKFDNRKTLILKNGRATVKNLNFTNGTIEVEIYAKSKRSFAGISFREQDDTLEEVYMRLHKSNQADAVQYTPLFNNESNWQLYREHQATTSFKDKGWNSLRIEIQNRSAEVFVNNIKVMNVDNLRTEQKEGNIGLWALFGNRFSNFRVTHRTVSEKQVSTETKINDSGIINLWGLTKAYSYTEGKVQFEYFSNEKYTMVSTEESGLLPISKYVKKITSGSFEQNKEDYVVARTTINSKEENTQVFSFDYSDKVLVFLNGQLLFSGNNAFRSKGIQYQGHIDINANKLYLNLRKGKNVLHCVVVDKANGWGIIGKLE